MAIKELPDKYVLCYEEYDELIREEWNYREQEFPDRLEAYLAAMNLVMERQKYVKAGIIGEDRGGAVREVTVAVRHQQEEVLKTFDYDTILVQVIGAETPK